MDISQVLVLIVLTAIAAYVINKNLPPPAF